MQFSLLCLVAAVVQLYEPVTMRWLSKTANLLCSILCRRLVRTGMPAATSSSIIDDLCPAIVRSVTMRTRAPRRWAAIMAFAIFGLLIE